MTEVATEAPVQSPPGKSAPATLRQGVLLVLFFGLGLFGTAAVVRSFMPFPPIPGIRDKIEWFAKNGDRFDTLFIGSSRVYRQLNPSLFDHLMAEAGLPTHSFNLGMDAMSTPEDSFVLEKVLAQRRKPLKWVITECLPIRVKYVEGGTEGTIRHAYWHDTRRFCALIGTMFGPSADERVGFAQWLSKSWNKAFKPIGVHLQLYLARMLNVGRGLEWMNPPAPVLEFYAGPKLDGYDGVDRMISEAEIKELREQIANRIQPDYTPDFGDASSQSLLLYKRRMAEAHGARTVLFIPPSSGENFYPCPTFWPKAPLIDLSDPRLYPDLYKMENRCDHGHLNAKGADLLTRLLAEKLAASAAHR